MTHADMILTHGRITTLDPSRPEASAVAIAEGRFLAVGAEADVMKLAGPSTQRIDLRGRRVIPGLHDSHIHVIRGGLTYALELRWDGVTSIADAMDMLRQQVAITPAPHWVRVVGGFTADQFDDRRLPTLEEINRVAPETPVFILHLYDRALLNRAALRACGYDRDTPDPPGGAIERDAKGDPTGLLLAKPNALLLYATLAKGPVLNPDEQLLSTRHFMRELNRLGVTSVIDAGGGFQRYPDDYAVVRTLAADGQLTLRIAYNLFTQNKGKEREDFEAWTKMLRPGQGDDAFRHNGAGEMLVFSAADFEDFREPRPDLPPEMEPQLEDVVRLLATHRWPFRLHATYDETISRALDVFERVNADVPLAGLNWFFDHAETISPRSIDRVARLGGGIAVQHRMVYQGEAFRARYGTAAAANAPPIGRMLAAGVPLGAGTDATRVASYNPWVSIAWLVTGRSAGGESLRGPENLVERDVALRLWTEANAWFSSEVGKKGRIEVGQLADVAVLSEDFFAVRDSAITDITSVLTLLGGRVVHGAAEYARLAPPLPPIAPDWSPVRRYGGYQQPRRAPGHATLAPTSVSSCLVHPHGHRGVAPPGVDRDAFWGALGCACWAF